jgi:hypothetical protein
VNEKHRHGSSRQPPARSFGVLEPQKPPLQMTTRPRPSCEGQARVASCAESTRRGILRDKIHRRYSIGYRELGKRGLPVLGEDMTLKSTALFILAITCSRVAETALSDVFAQSDDARARILSFLLPSRTSRRLTLRTVQGRELPPIFCIQLGTRASHAGLVSCCPLPGRVVNWVPTSLARSLLLFSSDCYLIIPPRRVL